MGRKIVLITAGEWPSVQSLLVSQVLETAKLLNTKGYKSSIFCVVPLLSYIKRVMLNQKDLIAVRDLCVQNHVAFHYTIIPVTLGSPFSFFYKSFFHNKAAEKIVKTIDVGTDELILHGRSYYASEIASLVKKQVQERLKVIKVIASFDMRSTLPDEVAINNGFWGQMLYGALKKYEHNLLKSVDCSFLPLNFVRKHYYESSGVQIHYAPIQGFEREKKWNVDFETRWKSKRIGYSGSIGIWNNAGLLKDVFELFETFRPSLAIPPTPELKELENKFYSIIELPSYYDSLLCLVIPGIGNADCYFVKSKLRLNFFSTKASEALSRGVPLIVSSELLELADFVIKYDCGVVFDLVNHKPQLRPIDTQLSKDRWVQLTLNAENAGKLFTRDAAIDYYEKVWNEEFNKLSK